MQALPRQLADSLLADSLLADSLLADSLGRRPRSGRHLVQASALLPPSGADVSLGSIRTHAAELLGCTPTGWQTLAVHRIPDALPAQTPPFSTRRTVRVAPGLHVCGDHRDTASIQGALVSGRRTAQDLLAPR